MISLSLAFFIAAAAAYAVASYNKDANERVMLCLTGIFGIAAMVIVIWSLK